MPRVPEYQRTETLRPAFRENLSANATPQAFGSDVGRGMQQLGGAVGEVADAVAKIKEYENEARAKDADNAYANWAIDRMHGTNGYLNSKGRSAVDTYEAIDAQIEEKRKEFAAGLNPRAAQMYDRASQARRLSLRQQATIHMGSERKSWIVDSSKARTEVFHNDAVANWNMPGQRQTAIAAGKLELGTLGDSLGWGEDERKIADLQFTTKVHQAVALEYARTDYEAADKYLKDNAGAIDPDSLSAIREKLEPDRVNAEAETSFAGLLGGGRTFAGGDSSASPAGGAIPARTTIGKGDAGVRNFLRGRQTAGRNDVNVDNLDKDFATNLATMIHDAPPEIQRHLNLGSGFRDGGQQDALWRAELAKQGGNVAAARKNVAPPGKSRHEHGDAMDLQFGSDAARQWVHANAGKYGLNFPLDHEPWHVEASGARTARVTQNGSGASPVAGLPDPVSAWNYVQTIKDPAVRQATWQKYQGYMSVQSAADTERRKAAGDAYWGYILKGQTPDQIPMEVRREAGMSMDGAAWSYVRANAEGGGVTTNEGVFNSLVQEAEAAPTVFVNRNIAELAPNLSKQDLRSINKLQATKRAALNGEPGDTSSLLKYGMGEAKARLDALGISTTGKKAGARVEMAKRVLDFQNTLARQIMLSSGDKGKPLTKEMVLDMVNGLTADHVFTKPGMLWGTNETTKVVFEIDYADIPVADRDRIEDEFKKRNPLRFPTKQQVEDMYQSYTLNRN